MNRPSSVLLSRSVIEVHLEGLLLRAISLNVPLPPRFRKNRYSSAPESWVRWRSFAMSVSARSCPGCKLTSGVTWLVRTTRNSRSNAWPSWSSRGIWESTSNSAPGRGGNCGRRSSLYSTSLVSRTKWPWVSLWDRVSTIIEIINSIDQLFIQIFANLFFSLSFFYFILIHQAIYLFKYRSLKF